MTWDLEARDKQLWSPRQEGDPGRPYLWLCDPPPWGTCPLPTTCASGFPGGCSPAAGEWPDQTRPERRSLGVTGEPKTQDVSAPSASLCSLARPQPHRHPPCPCSAGGEGLGSPQEHGLHCAQAGTLRGEDCVLALRAAPAISTSLLSMLTGTPSPRPRPHCGSSDRQLRLPPPHPGSTVLWNNNNYYYSTWVNPAAHWHAVNWLQKLPIHLPPGGQGGTSSVTQTSRCPSAAYFLLYLN